jgi:acetoin utilization protein AcuB
MVSKEKNVSAKAKPRARKSTSSRGHNESTARRPVIADFMTRSPHTIGSDQPLEHARQLMNRHRIRHLPVLEGGRLVGLVSQRDVYFVEALDIGGDKSEIMVDEAMSREVFEADLTTPVAQVVAIMVRKKLGCAVITNAGRVVGVFSTIDAMNLLQRYL